MHICPRQSTPSDPSPPPPHDPHPGVLPPPPPHVLSTPPPSSTCPRLSIYSLTQTHFHTHRSTKTPTRPLPYPLHHPSTYTSSTLPSSFCTITYIKQRTPRRRRNIGYRGLPQGSPHPNCFRLYFRRWLRRALLFFTDHSRKPGTTIRGSEWGPASAWPHQGGTLRR